MLVFTYFYKIIKKIISDLRRFQWIIVYFKFKLNKVRISNFKSNGIPLMAISLGAHVQIGEDFTMNNGMYHNMIGRQQPCIFAIARNAQLIIKKNVGISATAIICWEKIIIGNNVRIGGGTVIYDTDFHSLDYRERAKVPENRFLVKTHSVEIGDNVFIGANCTILKGVTIGENSIIGACSVVSKSIPKNEIWAGNPAVFIRKINLDER